MRQQVSAAAVTSWDLGILENHPRRPACTPRAQLQWRQHEHCAWIRTGWGTQKEAGAIETRGVALEGEHHAGRMRPSAGIARVRGQRLTRRVSLHSSAAVSGEMWLGLPQLTAARSLAAWDPPRGQGSWPPSWSVRWDSGRIGLLRWLEGPARRAGPLARPGTHVREGCCQRRGGR